jgi:uncharacterized protein YndB with AHSA1/START domain
MIATHETVFTKDETNKKIKVTREFDAPVERVWKSWTNREMLDQWWAPKPWKANTTSMDFREGGTWLYYMQGPEGERHYAKVVYETIASNKSFSGTDGFCDENGKVIEGMPSMHWKCVFSKSGAGTKVDVDITFPSAEDMEKILEMGVQEGFAMAHNNLDELLAKQNA